VNGNIVDLDYDYAPFWGFYPGGGGICSYGNSSPVITNSVIAGNLVIPYKPPVELRTGMPVGGGGVSCQQGGKPVITGCEIYGNSIPGYDLYDLTLCGGGLFLADVESKITDCDIYENTCGLVAKESRNGFRPYVGGGLCCVFGMTWMDDCRVTDNVSYLGGGFYFEGSGAAMEETTGPGNYAVITGTVIAKNYGAAGGGMLVQEATWMDIWSSTIAANLAEGGGGILEDLVWGAETPSPWIVPEAWRVPPAPLRTRDAERSRSPSSIGLYETILWGNCAGAGVAEEAHFTGQAEFVCCDVNKDGVAPGGTVTYDPFTIFTDPMFCCPPDCGVVLNSQAWPVWDVADFRIDYFSPCTKANSPCGKRIGALGVKCRGYRCEQFYHQRGDRLTSIVEEQPEGGTLFRMLPPVPNPFNPSTEIHFSIPAGSDPSPVKLSIYNARGQKVRTLIDEELPPGIHQATWDGTDERGVGVASGVYFSRLLWNGKSDTRRMILLK